MSPLMVFYVNFLFLSILVMIGNSLTFKTKERKQMLWQPQCMTMNFSNLMMNSNLDALVKFIDLQGFKIGK